MRNQKANDPIAKIIFSQLVRSVTSIGANLVEAQAASSRKDFINFYSYALKSANESQFWFCLLRDDGICPKGEIADLLDEASQLSKIIGSCIINLKKSNGK